MMDMILTNARLVLDDEIIDDGTLVAGADGRIREISKGPTEVAGALDCEGDYLIPGLIELHTDNLEKHITPRPKTNWPSVAAVVAHDSQLAAAGITTVLDAIAIGSVVETSERVHQLESMVTGISNAKQKDLLRADHLLHLRCEVSYPKLKMLFDEFVSHPLLRLVSIMDHTPGQRQFISEEQYRIYYQGKFGLSDKEMAAFTLQRKRDQKRYGDAHRRYVVTNCQKQKISLASHDDATQAHVDEAVADGMSIAEFPTTVDAAKASHQAGLKVMMGGPNIVRGGSHSGNVSARELAQNDVLDIVSSDYVPNSMLHAAFKLTDGVHGFELPKAIRAVSKTPAEASNLFDRGEIAIGKRADLVRVHHTPDLPLVKGVWRETQRIA
ncbi:MAG: alpha-D-ribose 1-methylphosphonate 5-triphosphate diphosphatase [Pseudomonadota bacterium]|nr:alpha-D-ribose 1-methylphosphonate 5-triphosphate diphosphatase [Pseudomonadota bacterium]